MDKLSPQLIPLVVVLAVWTISWKGMALWKAARSGSKPWFVILLLVNTLGILEILYIYVFSKPKPAAAADETVPPQA